MFNPRSSSIKAPISFLREQKKEEVREKGDITEYVAFSSED
jgi:hypothetical protein